MKHTCADTQVEKTSHEYRRGPRNHCCCTFMNLSTRRRDLGPPGTTPKPFNTNPKAPVKTPRPPKRTPEVPNTFPRLPNPRRLPSTTPRRCFLGVKNPSDAKIDGPARTHNRGNLVHDDQRTRESKWIPWILIFFWMLMDSHQFGSATVALGTAGVK